MSGFSAELLRLTQQSRSHAYTPTPRQPYPTIGEMAFNLALSTGISVWQTASKLTNNQLAQKANLIAQESKTGLEYQTRFNNEILPTLKWSMWGDPYSASQLKTGLETTAGAIDFEQLKKTQNLREHNAANELAHLASHTGLNRTFKNIEDYKRAASEISKSLASDQPLSPQWTEIERHFQATAEQNLLFSKNVEQAGASRTEALRSIFIDKFNEIKELPENKISVSTLDNIIDESSKVLGGLKPAERRNLINDILEQYDGTVVDQWWNKQQQLPENQFTQQEIQKIDATRLKNRNIENRQFGVRQQSIDNAINERINTGAVPLNVNLNSIQSPLTRAYLEQWQQHGEKFAQVGLGLGGLNAVSEYYKANGQPELAAKFQNTASEIAIFMDNDLKEFIFNSPYVKKIDKNTWGDHNVTRMAIDPDTGLVKESTLDSFLSSWATRNMMFWDFKSRYTPEDHSVMNPLSAAEKKATQEIFSNLTPKDGFDLAIAMLQGSDSSHPESQNTNTSNLVAHALGEPEMSFFLQYSKFAGIEQARKSYFDFKTHMGKATELEQKLQTKSGYGKLVSAVRELYGVNEMQARGMSAFVVSKTPSILTAKETLEKGLTGDTISAVDKYFQRAKSSDTVLKGLIVPGNEMIKGGKKNLVKQLQQLHASESSPLNLYEAIKAGKDGIKIGETTYVFTIKNSHVKFNDFIVTQKEKDTGKTIAQQTITMLPQSSWWELWN